MITPPSFACQVMSKHSAQKGGTCALLHFPACLSIVCVMQSRGMTNAHAIVPGMPPSSAGRGPNTAWQVGLAAGLAATANFRPPNPSLGHQAATTAAAARAAAAFQASRALSMAKSYSQQSPLLQQGSVGANVSGESCAG